MIIWPACKSFSPVFNKNQMFLCVFQKLPRVFQNNLETKILGTPDQQKVIRQLASCAGGNAVALCR